LAASGAKAFDYFKCCGTTEQVAEQRACATNRVPQRLKPSLIPNGFRGPEGPLFHGAARMRQFAASCEVVPFPILYFRG